MDLNSKIRRFFLDKSDLSEIVTISGSDALHIIKVLRMRRGDFIELFDGEGTDYRAKIESISSKNVKVVIKEKIKSLKQFSKKIILAQGLLKDKKMDLIIRQLTELGVDKLVFFRGDRSVSIISKDKICFKINKWKKISIESSKQCRRKYLPEIIFIENFDSVLEMANKKDLNIVFIEINFSRIDILKELIKKKNNFYKRILIIIGPEGGFSKKEIRKLNDNFFYLVNLGSRILKSETASITAFSIIQYLFG